MIKAKDCVNVRVCENKSARVFAPIVRVESGSVDSSVNDFEPALKRRKLMFEGTVFNNCTFNMS